MSGREIARHPTGDAVHAEGDERQYLTFRLSGEIFAIGILTIKEIIEYGDVTQVPMMPPSIRGVINLRGAVVPVIDLAALFGRNAVGVTRRTCIVIIEAHMDGEYQDVGLVVDAVNAVTEIPRDQIEPVPAFGAKVRTDFIRGMGKVDGRFVIILNLDRIMSTDDLALFQQIREAELTEQAATA